MDYSSTGQLSSPTTTVESTWVDQYLDDMVPLSWLGSSCYGSPPVADLEPMDGSVIAPGTSIAISGRVGRVDPTRRVVEVTIDGAPALVDEAGRFMAMYTVQSGDQSVPITLTDRCGETTVTLTLHGRLSSPALPALLTASQSQPPHPRPTARPRQRPPGRPRLR